MAMTLPFENDTNAVVKKLAKQNIKANHRTALSIMSAILIAATFMCTLCSLVQSYWNQRVQQEILIQELGCTDIRSSGKSD